MLKLTGGAQKWMIYVTNHRITCLVSVFHLSCLGLVAGADKKHGLLPVGGF